jgi:acetolactate synthase-1/3 small subunit
LKILPEGFAMAHSVCLTVFSDNNPGLLHRVTAVFTRRKINIESLTVSETEFPGVSRYTIVINTEKDTAGKLAEQIRKIIEVHEVIVGDDEAMVSREVALIKILRREDSGLSQVITDHQLVLVSESAHVLIFERTGAVEEVSDALFALRPFGIIEFVRSGRISMAAIPSRWNEAIHSVSQGKGAE